jgi:hypothetical protein
LIVRGVLRAKGVWLGFTRFHNERLNLI